MANQGHLNILKHGVEAWNEWRKEHPEVRPNLREAQLIDAHLSEADFSGTNLNSANLSRANLCDADLREATLYKADLRQAKCCTADFRKANLSEANLCQAILNEARFNKVNFQGANLSEADLTWSILSEANLNGADLTACAVYAISAWGVQLENTIQAGLIITDATEPTITVDNLEMAQFIHLLLNNKKIRDVIDTIAKKAVLILGRFTPERKPILDTIRDELRKRDYLPIIFDFEKPSSRNFTEVVRTLAHLSRFIITDLTDPSSNPQELYAIIPTLAVPVQPLLEASRREYSMFSDFSQYHWVLPIYQYADLATLIATLNKQVIEPAERKAKELENH